MALLTQLHSAKNRRNKRFLALLEESGLFDPSWYWQRNLDVANAKYDPLQHYIRHGRAENRSPGPAFDAPWYAQTYKTRIAPGSDACEHYLTIGKREGLLPLPPAHPVASVSEYGVAVNDRSTEARLRALDNSGLFDRDFYLEKNADVREAMSDPLLHFVCYGSVELRDPNPNFDAFWYAEQYLLESASEREPVFHYLNHGRDLGLKTKPKSIYGDWLDNYYTVGDDDVRRVLAQAPEKAVLVVLLPKPVADDDLETSDQAAFCALYTPRVLVGAPDFADIKPLDERVRTVEDCSRLIAALPDETIILFCRDGVTLRRNAFCVLASFLDDAPAVLYSDFDYIDKAGHAAPYFFPHYAPNILSQISEQIGLFAINKSAFKQLENTRLDDTSVGALFLSCCAQIAAPPLHSSFVAYTDRHPDGAPARAKPAPFRASAGGRSQSVSIIIPTKNNLKLLKTCVDSISNLTEYDGSYEIVIVDNNTDEFATAAYLADLATRPGFKVLPYPEPFNYSAMNNLAARASRSDVLILLNNDTVVIRPDWLTLITRETSKSDVGAVGVKLLYPDNTVQHGGVVVGIQGVAAHSHTGFPANALGYQGLNTITREVSAVTGACMAVRRVLYYEVGGLDTDLQVAFNDIAFCVELKSRGYRNIWVDKAVLYHLESKTRGFDLSPAKKQKFFEETITFNRLYWSKAHFDDCYSNNLSLQKLYELADPPRDIPRWQARYDDVPTRKRRILMLSWTLRRGHGVAVVLKIQVQALLDRGYDVYVAGPYSKDDMEIEGTRRFYVSTPDMAARLAVRRQVDVVIVHTPPFYSIMRYIGSHPAVILYDYGEPPVSLFPDSEARLDVNREKILCFAMAKWVAAISQAVADESAETLTVLPLGNSHLSTWTPDMDGRRRSIRQKLGWTDAYVILNVCRFHKAERYYKGVNEYAEAALRAQAMNQGRRVIVVICGRGDPDDVTFMRDKGLQVFANVTDEEIIELYLASDLYISLSKWEGYNLGVGQALALGLPVLGSAIPAHAAFGIETYAHEKPLLRRINEMIAAKPAERRPQIHDWAESLDAFLRYVEACLEETDRSAKTPARFPLLSSSNAGASHGVRDAS